MFSCYPRNNRCPWFVCRHGKSRNYMSPVCNIPQRPRVSRHKISLGNISTCRCYDGLTAMRLADCAGLLPRVSEPDEDEKCSMTSQLDLRGTGGGVCTSGSRADRAGEVDSSRLACRLLMAPAKPARPCCRRLRLRRVNRGFPVAAATSYNT